MATQTFNLLPQATRTNFHQRSAAVQMPANTLRVELRAVCTDYTDPAQKIAIGAYKAPVQAGPFDYQFGASNQGGYIDPKTGLPENALDRSTDVAPNEWGTWWQGDIQTTGTITFRLDLIVTT